ncbi:hypothetical protein QYE76_060979 [Lolium multiflorum]|uniref:CCHC-type domain-containing protein n=1 Tax=Lolium multiflorum TaxID=4521 RepID=A0AAD8W6S6_LOLMU|nr:hypothetical protein QYE76_060979 [Lolium multiflorum]
MAATGIGVVTGMLVVDSSLSPRIFLDDLDHDHASVPVAVLDVLASILCRHPWLSRCRPVLVVGNGRRSPTFSIKLASTVSLAQGPRRPTELGGVTVERDWNMNKEFPELFGMLKAAEIEIKKEHQVLMVNKTTSFKKQGKSKGKFKKGGKKAATPPMKPKNGPKPDAECYYCKEKGHWKRNCSKYLADLKSGLVKKKKEEMRNTFTIDTGNTTTKRSEVPENVLYHLPATEEANDNDHETSNETATEPRRSTRDRATPDWYDPCLNVMIVDNNDEDPATYEEAMMSPDSNKWQEAMKSEMGSMYDNKVWTLVELPDSRKAVENKWIFKRKTDADGNIVYKARLVAKGFRQIQGVDYDETFSL